MASPSFLGARGYLDSRLLSGIVEIFKTKEFDEKLNIS